MPTFIFNSISDLKQFVGGGANLSVELASIASAMHSALHLHVKPWLGEAQWAALLADYTANVEDLDGMDADLAALLPYVQRPLALLTMYEYAAVGGVQFSEAGIQRIETDTRKSAFKYQENAYRKWHLENGYEALEEMLEFLEANEVAYLDWQESDAYTANKALVINTAAELRKHYAKHVSRYTFEVIRPIIEDVETFAVKPMLGPAQYTQVKGWIMDKADDLDEVQQKLLKLIRRVVAKFSIEEAIKLLWVKIDGKNVVETEGLEPQTYEKYSSPAGSGAINLTLRHLTEHADSYIQELRAFLDDNLETFTLYATYKEELEAAAEEAAEEAAAEASNDGSTVRVSTLYKDDFDLNIPSRNARGKGIITL